MTRLTERLNRMLLMVPLMARDEGVAIEELTGKFDMTREELMDDLKLLWMCGLPDYGGGCLMEWNIQEDRVYFSNAEYFKRPLRITRDEALGLLVAGDALMRAEVVNTVSPVVSALDKVISALPGEDSEDIRRLADRIEIDLEKHPGRMWERLEEGIQSGFNLVIEYYSFSTGEVGTREVEPISLLNARGHWYLLAWCHEAEDRRLFRLDRIKSAVLSGNRSEASSRIGQELPLVVGEYSPGRHAHHVELHFGGREGRDLAEEWPTAELTESPDGSTAISFRTRNLAWLSCYLLRFGDRVRVTAPAALRKMLRDNADRMLGEYR